MHTVSREDSGISEVSMLEVIILPF
jgi:hypothetical protein